MTEETSKYGDDFDDCVAWLREFEKINERPLRVLHVGNIANNAYLNAKFLRRVGVQADVLCHSYYHIMGYPEWEEINIRDPYGDDVFPSFSSSDLKGFQRPDWFVQGPLSLCIKYLEAQFSNKKLKKYLFKYMLKFSMRSAFCNMLLKFRMVWFKHAFIRYCLPKSLKNKVRLIKKALVKKVNTLIEKKQIVIIKSFLKRLMFLRNSASDMADFRELALKIIAKYDVYFPDRVDRLTLEDLYPYLNYLNQIHSVFNYYDIIQCYGTEPILGLISGKKPYVAFEHGTLRDFTIGDSGLHRLNALAYRNADHVFITNGDCLSYAQRLSIKNFSPMIHPVDVKQHRQKFDETKEDIKARYNAEVLLFCPLRHDWSVKGTDICLRALPLIRKQFKGRVVLLATNWGADLEKSYDLVRELDCEKNVVWLPPLSRIAMIKYTQAADVILDQMILPCFGVTAPQALAVGTPVIMSYKPITTQWIINEPAPIISAFTPQDIVDGVVCALNQEWLSNFRQKALSWIDLYHSSENIIRDHLTIYRNLIGGQL